ncbi:MAG: hypothetical protein IJH34_02795, partial [Romboutsia sp.]|nr:hypothetical protein [Romboutsia sp.]
MSKQELRRAIEKITNQNVAYGLKVYAYLKEDSENRKLKIINSLDPMNDKIKELISEVVLEQYLDESIEFDDISNIVDNRKIVYELKQNAEYEPFKFLKTINSVNEQFCDKDIDNLFGFIFKLNLNEKEVFIYQQAYSGTRITSKKVLHMIKIGP